MKELYVAIRDKLIADDELMAMVNDVYFVQAPEGADFPYIVFHEIDATPDWTFADTYETHRIQFSIFSDDDSPIVVFDILARLRELLDWTELQLSSATTIYIKPITEHSLLRDEGVWHQAVDYEVSLEKGGSV